MRTGQGKSTFDVFYEANRKLDAAMVYSTSVFVRSIPGVISLSSERSSHLEQLFQDEYPADGRQINLLRMGEAF